MYVRRGTREQGVVRGGSGGRHPNRGERVVAHCGGSDGGASWRVGNVPARLSSLRAHSTHLPQGRQTMKRLYTFVTAYALGMAFSGCVQLPTAADGSGHTVGNGNATGARFSVGQTSGGYTVGSGNRATTPGEPSDTSSAATVSSTGGETATDTTGVVERGGHTFGSGN